MLGESECPDIFIPRFTTAIEIDGRTLRLQQVGWLKTCKVDHFACNHLIQSCVLKEIALGCPTFDNERCVPSRFKVADA